MKSVNKIDITNINIENKEHITDFYVFKNDENKVGYGFITNQEKDKVKIYIDEKYRSNGYGRIFFGNILSILNDKVIVKTDNPHMINIIKYYSGEELSNDNGTITFIIPKHIEKEN